MSIPRTAPNSELDVMARLWGIASITGSIFGLMLSIVAASLSQGSGLFVGLLGLFLGALARHFCERQLRNGELGSAEFLAMKTQAALVTLMGMALAFSFDSLALMLLALVAGVTTPCYLKCPIELRPVDTRPRSLRPAPSSIRSLRGASDSERLFAHVLPS